MLPDGHKLAAAFLRYRLANFIRNGFGLFATVRC
jgi:hypothetical protein